MNKNIVISVIIPTCNRMKLLGKCLDQLNPKIQDFPINSYEVIVSDDSTDDSILSFIKDQYSWAIYTNGPRRGPAANRNNGANLAQGEWLVFTDDDCIPESTLLSKYYAAIKEKPSNKAFEGAIIAVGAYNPSIEECPVNIEGGCFWSANVCINKNLFNKIKGFDENYPQAALEDQDIYYRLLNETEISFEKDAIVKHPVRKINFWRNIKNIPASARTWAYHAQKHNSFLGFNNKYSILLKSIWFYLKDILKQLKNNNKNNLVHRLTYLLVGIPVLFYFLYLKNPVKTES